MYCKNCKLRMPPTDLGEHPYCSSEKIVENDYVIASYESDGNRLIYSYSENGKFYVEDYFGCVHFEAQDLIEKWDIPAPIVNIMDIPFYNEACAICGIPRDLHLNPNEPNKSTPETNWGDLNRCKTFVRCNPPRAAYGVLGK